MRLLIVDDSSMVRRSLRDTLGRALGRPSFGEAGSVREGLALLEGQDWDLVLLDLSLPDRSGMAALAAFRRSRPALPILVMSMHPASQFAPAVAAAGAAGYLAKGSDPEAIVAAVRAAAAASPSPCRPESRAAGPERRQISRVLHDDVGQLLAAMKINLRLAASSEDLAEMRARTLEAVGLVDQAIGSVRRLLSRLSPPLLDELGLLAALQALVAGLQAEAARSGLRLTLSPPAPELPRRFDAELEEAAFLIVEEAVANVLRHARARSATVGLRLEDGALWIEVRDDGRGFDVVAEREQRGHAGLAGIRERVRARGGRCEIRSTAAGGTELQVVLPA